MRKGMARSRILVTLWAATCGVAAMGQTEPGEPALQFRVVGFGESFFEGLRYESERGETQELKFLPDRRSRLYPIYRDMREIEFFVEDLDDRGRPQRVAQAKALVEPGARQVLFVFLGEGVGATGRELAYQTLVLDESPGRFGPGDIRMLNLTSAPLDGRLGEGTVRLEPRSSALARVVSEPPQPVGFSLFVDAGSRRRLVCETRLMPDSMYGLLYVIKPPSQSGSLRVRLEKLW